MNFILISEVIRSYLMLKPNEISNELILKATLIKEEIGTYSWARPTFRSIMVFLLNAQIIFYKLL